MRKQSKWLALLCILAILMQLCLVVPAAAAGETQTSYVLSDTVTAGEKYVIVSNGYALTNKTANVSAANGGVSLAATAVTVGGGKITSAVTDDMVWSFAAGTSAKCGKYTTGFFLTNGTSKYLSRGSSGGAGVAGLNTATYDAANVDQKPHYCYWAFEDVTAATSTKSMFLFSSTSTDYVFFLRGAEVGFDAPGVSQDNMDSNLANYTVQLYKAVSGGAPQTEKPLHELLFLSDLHAGKEGFTSLRAMLPALKNEGFSPEVLSFGGDYVEDSQGTSVSWPSVFSTLTSVIDESFPTAARAYTMGNHDWEALNEESFKSIFGFSRTGVTYSGNDYEIYMIGAQGNTTAGVDKEIFYESDITALDAYLSSRETSGKVIFVQTHWPLHRAYNWSWRNIANADKLIDVLNKHGDKQDIVFLWGHNHYTDPNRQTVLQRGDSLLYAENASKTIKFTYASVGCMNDMYPTQASSKETGVGPAVCLSAAVYGDKVVLTYNRIENAGTAQVKFSHSADITISGTAHTNPAVVNVPLQFAAGEGGTAGDVSEICHVGDVAFTPGRLGDVNGNLGASVKVRNKTDAAQNCLMIVALYDPTGRMVNYSYLGKQLAAGGSEQFNAGFQSPFSAADAGGYALKAFVWDGLTLQDTQAKPMSNVSVLDH